MVDQHYKTAQRGTCTGVLAGRLQISRTNRSRRLTKGRANRLNQDPRAAVNLPPPKPSSRLLGPIKPVPKAHRQSRAKQIVTSMKNQKNRLRRAVQGRQTRPAAATNWLVSNFPRPPEKELSMQWNPTTRREGEAESTDPAVLASANHMYFGSTASHSIISSSLKVNKKPDLTKMKYQ